MEMIILPLTRGLTLAIWLYRESSSSSGWSCRVSPVGLSTRYKVGWLPLYMENGSNDFLAFFAWSLLESKRYFQGLVSQKKEKSKIVTSSVDIWDLGHWACLGRRFFQSEFFFRRLKVVQSAEAKEVQTFRKYCLASGLVVVQNRDNLVFWNNTFFFYLIHKINRSFA